MKILNNVKNILLYAGTDKITYEKINHEIVESNRKIISLFSAVAQVALCIMEIMSFFDASLVKNRLLYLLCILLLASIHLISITIAKKSYLIVNILIYFFSAILFAFGIVLDTFIGPEEVTVSFIVLLISVPLLFTCRPMYMDIEMALGIIVYLICAKKTQNDIIFGYNITNVVPYGILSIFICTYMMKIKVERISLSYSNRLMSELDQLTGLLNRRSYELRLNSLRDDKDATYTFCVFDINGLKRINDTLGHVAGDELICGAAQCITSAFEEYGKCYRIGGDEFVSILENCHKDKDEIRLILLAKTTTWKGELVNELSVSIGIVSSNEYQILEKTIIEADKRMYLDKKQYYSQIGYDRRH